LRIVQRLMRRFDEACWILGAHGVGLLLASPADHRGAGEVLRSRGGGA
jgi:hypothetical protein